MSGQDDGVAGFAALLRDLKERTDRSYGSLARRLQMNTSTLHRYCAGDAVPQDFAPVERFAALCGATPEERVELHRRWLAAVAARRRPRAEEAVPAPVDAPPPHAAPAVPPKPEPEAEPKTGSEPGPEPGPEAEPEAGSARVSAPWYRRRRLAVGLAVACASLAAVGSLAALPTDRGTSAEVAPSARTTVAAPTTGAPGSPPPRTPSASPDGTRAAPGPSPAGTGPSPATPPTRPPAAPSPAAPAVPLAWTADSQVWAHGCGHDYVIGGPPAQVPPPPAPQDAGTWAAAQGAVHGRETTVRISVQGLSATAVVLEALRVRVAGRAEPAPGHAYAMDEGCGGALTPRHFAVDLDQDRPLARAVAGNDAGTPIPAVRMPYRVSAGDPEVLLVTARTAGCDCRWFLELDWSSQGRTGTVRIDDHGRPFRTSAIEGLPRHAYDTSARRWAPYV
ncbi:MAG TPA: helix-turn-helix domain-containing protein [Streptomyces sp.]|nr:helix-turn-helix domain-containing protein [Streptomyces sp.]HZF90326.1 helix-turn-helix domain-containing protein [Streptomyces sp.]